MIRRSIRDQILIPLVAVQVVAVATTSMVAAGLAAGRVEAEVARRVDEVVDTMGRSNFPITSGVLEKMQGLSGADFVACSNEGRVLESTLHGLVELPSSLRSLPDRIRVEPGRSPRVEIGGLGYFAASVRSTPGSERPTLVVLYPEATWRRARWDAAMPPMIIGLVAIAPMAGVTGWVAHRLGRRLESIRGKVASIAAGDFGEMADLGRSDEIHDLVGSVNRMSAQLLEMREAIRRAERAGLLAQLAAGLAHQLRNAATGARMAVQLHMRRCPGVEADRSLDVALRQLTLCEEQVKSLLASGRGDGRLISDCNVRRMVEDVAGLVEAACRHAGVVFSYRVENCDLVRVDADSVRASLLNLALNAIEAAGPGGRVSLDATDQGESLRFDVEDDGPGPPAELESTLFEPFVTGKPEGVGLGLAVASRVATDHGGELAWTRFEGRTRFRLTIPKDPGRGEGVSS